MTVYCRFACTARKVTVIINTRVQGGFSRLAEIFSGFGGFCQKPPKYVKKGGSPGTPLGGAKNAVF